MAQVNLAEERRRLDQLISQWNVDHLELFRLSEPNEGLEFHGAVRFYFQGAGANVVTKCIRVSSTASTKEVIDVLVEKFRPDMRMLTQNKYALYEVHVNGEERRLADEDRPLLVQLNWGRDVREGRFLLKRENEATAEEMELEMRNEPNFSRKLSKRERKEKKKREKKENKENEVKGDAGVGEKLYQDLPETSFTRSISNPEAVMRRRRQQKLEKRMEQMRSPDGGPDTGGMLKIYGETVRPDVPYKTLLVHIADTAAGVVMEAMAKYSLEKEDPSKYCLVQVVVPPSGPEYHGGSLGEERILDDTECPLALVMQHPKNKGQIIFQLRQRSAGGKQKQRPNMRGAVSHNDLRYTPEPMHIPIELQPYLQELRTRDMKRHHLPLNVTEVGSERSVSTSNQYLQLSGPDIKPRHCVIAHTEGVVTLTPTSRDAEVYVEDRPIKQTTMLKHGMTVQFGNGKAHIYKFCDPKFEERRRNDKPDHPYGVRPQETNFDLDGHVETVTPNEGRPGQGPRPTDRDDLQRRPDQGMALKAAPGQDFGPEDELPASVEFRDEAEDPLLTAIILDVNSRAVQFKLAPTYTLYMAIRHYLGNHFHPHTPPQLRSQRLVDMVTKIAKMIQDGIREHRGDPTALAFWMANASEVLHFFKQDRDIHVFSGESQELLAEAVQMAFHHLVLCLQGDLQRVMPAFLDPNDAEEDDRGDMNQQHYNSNRPTLADVLNTLSAAMTLLRRCRVNAALTIQFFSQLFHFINMWLFNIIVTEPQLQLTKRLWGIRLKRRLARIETWAEKQGLELAADCHLCRIIQAAHLLQAPKNTPDDITTISSTCFKLNSKQLRTLLSRYIPDPNEPPVSQTFIERVVTIAENMADELTRTDGREIRLEEDPDLRLPFLLPEDGYSCDTIRGIPSGLPEFVKPFTNAGLCNMIIHHPENGSWTVYMGDPRQLEKPPSGGMPPQRHPEAPRNPEVVTVAFHKVKGSMGLSIVAATGEGQRERGIYIKSVVPGGAAALDGRLQAGDQLLEVDGKSLVGLTQDKAAELMTRTGEVVNLKVAKQGAIYHGLATLLSQPSPTMPRAAQQKGLAVNNRYKPNGEEGPPPYTENAEPPGRQYPHDALRPQPSPRQSPQIQPGRGVMENHIQREMERQRAASSSNLPNDSRIQHPQQKMNDPNYYRRDLYEQDPRSKSTSNLHVDTSFERRDPHSMKPAQSVSALPISHPQGHYSPGGRVPSSPNYPPKMNDYENQPHVLNSSPPDAVKDGRMFPDINQNFAPGNKPNQFPGQYLQAQQHPKDRSSVSSRTSNSSGQRDNRPQSAYYDAHPREDPHQVLRPKSDEITPNRLREWQEKFEDPRVAAAQRQNHVQDNYSPPYSNIGPQYTREPNPNPKSAQERLFKKEAPTLQQPVNQNRGPQAGPYGQDNYQHPYGQDNQQRGYSQDIPKMNAQNQMRQANFYENTMPQQQEPQPPFHQIPRHSAEFQGKSKPAVANKPAVAAKPNQARVQPVEIPRSHVDNRLTQPNFYDSKPNVPQPDQSPGMNRAMNHQQPPYKQQLRPTQDLNSSYGARKFPPSMQDGSPYGYRGQQDQPPDTPPDLPPPPTDLHDDSPPLPPPPSQEYLLDQQLQEEQRRLLQQIGGPGAGMEQHAPNQGNMLPGQGYGGQMSNSGYGMDNRFVDQRGYPGAHPPAPQSQGASHPNYQNINFGINDVHNSGVLESQAPPLPQPPAEHNLYEQYDPHRFQSSNAQELKRTEGGRQWQQQQQQQQQPPSQIPPPAQLPQITPQQLPLPGENRATHLTVGEKEYSLAASPWEREEKERAMERQEMEMTQAREQEIADLESRSYLNPQEQERLRKLKLEQEFQRRVREISEKGDYEDDSDSEVAERLYSRERLIAAMKEDLEKMKTRMSDYDRRMMREEYHNERDRMQRLERRLEMFEKDREEQRERMKRRQERKQREHQEQLRQQREMREKQRQNYEEQKRLLMMEEEKMRQRREEEIQKRRQMEREQLQEMQAQRDAQEAALRAEARRKEEEYNRQRLQQQKEERLLQQREIRVSEERRRIDSLNAQVPPPQPQYGYQQYANLPPQPVEKENLAPAPPERTSSHDLVQQHRHSGRNFQAGGYRDPGPTSAIRMEPERAPPKKSVTFNTQLETQINTYSVSDDRTPNASVSSYRSSNSSQSSEQGLLSPSFNSQPPTSSSNDVFTSPADIRYHHSPGTPGVIGSQEVYRDPRLRIEQQKAQNVVKKPGPERMSFRDKMKYFAKEAGEDSPKYKPKASRTQRTIESQLNGQ